MPIISVQGRIALHMVYVNAAEIAVCAGIPVAIINGNKPTNIYKVVNGENVGTYFKAVKA